ncbi:MAG: transcriptional repressor [Elusimicrobia bacterium]|nr:transcriptional repressor [Elusimicrobiota bacterium]
MKIEPQKVFQQLLSSKGLKCTKQREEILDYLLKARKHVTPEEMYRDINRKDPALGRATVFRTLHLLEDSGFANSIHLANGRQAYEHKFARPHHDHMICVECSAVIEFSSATIERIQEQITKEHTFSPLWHRHEIFGRCKKCASPGRN